MNFSVVSLLLVYASVLVVDAGISMHNPFYCYSTDRVRPLSRMHSTQTSYEAVHRPTFDPAASTCTPSRIWILFRHGGQRAFPAPLQDMINFAESSIIADIANNYEAGRTTLCRQDFELIQNWTTDPNVTMENANTPSAGNEATMRNIARRYQQYFPTLLTEDYSHDRFHFRHVRSLMANASIRAFASGLFGENEAENVIFEDIPDIDSFLLPTSHCPLLVQETADGHQLAAFRQGPEFEEMVEQVNRKLGFHGSNQLSVNSVLAMANWCRRPTMDQFAFSNPEADIAWCAPFTIANTLVIEYFFDLSYFYGVGYGVRNRRLVENLNCGLVQDVLTHMQSENRSDQTARVFVSHSPVLQALMVTFGLFEDPWPLHQHNFAQQSARLWLTSLITPSAGNVVVVRYDCADGDHDLLFLLNERPLAIPGCMDNGICKLSFILNRFERFLNANCDELFCSSD